MSSKFDINVPSDGLTVIFKMVYHHIYIIVAAFIVVFQEKGIVCSIFGFVGGLCLQDYLSEVYIIYCKEV